MAVMPQRKRRRRKKRKSTRGDSPVDRAVSVLGRESMADDDKGHAAATAMVTGFHALQLLGVVCAIGALAFWVGGWGWGLWLLKFAAVVSALTVVWCLLVFDEDGPPRW